MKIAGKRTIGSHAWVRASAPWGLLLMVVLASCASPRDNPEAVHHGTGVAVTVTLEGGHVVPGIFRGPRDEARDLSGGTFHFTGDSPRVLIMRPGSHWIILDESRELRAEMAVTVLREDGSLAPGSFFGPPRLAERLSEALATERGVVAVAPTVALILPETHSRVRITPPGAAVRSADWR